MGLIRAVKKQFGHPRGLLGHLAGKIMANRSSNLERNRWTISLLEIQPGDRVLEIGFGPGVAIEEISRKLVDGVVAGVDHSEVMLRHARARNEEGLSQGRVDLRLGSVVELPDFGDPFDKMFAVNSMMFWEEPVDRLRDLGRKLKPGGVIAITHQPRLSKATDELARESGDRIAAALERAGYVEIRVELKEMEPVAAVCVLAVKRMG
jgi:ubiquinone/menaquinone biosynthesis C-methylase UbiE